MGQTNTKYKPEDDPFPAPAHQARQHQHAPFGNKNAPSGNKNGAMAELRLAVRRPGRQRKLAQRSRPTRGPPQKAPHGRPSMTPVESLPREVGLPSTPPLKSMNLANLRPEPSRQAPLPAPIPYVPRRVRVGPDPPPSLRRINPAATRPSSMARRQRSSVSQDARSLSVSLKRRQGRSPAARPGESFGPVLPTTSASTPASRRTSTEAMTSARASSVEEIQRASDTPVPTPSQRPQLSRPSREKEPVTPQKPFHCNLPAKKLAIRPDGPAAARKRSSAQGKMSEPICDAGILSSQSEGSTERMKPLHRQRGFQTQPISAFSTCSSSTETDSPATYVRHARKQRPITIQSDGSMLSAADRRASPLVHGSSPLRVEAEPSSSSLDVTGMFLGAGSSQQSECNSDAPREWIWVSKEQEKRDTAEGINLLRQELADMTIHSSNNPAQDPTVLRSRSDASGHASIQHLPSPSEAEPHASISGISNGCSRKEQSVPTGRRHPKPLPTPPLNHPSPSQAVRPSFRRLTTLAEESKDGSRSSSRQSLADERTLVATPGVRTPLVHSNSSSSTSLQLLSPQPKSTLALSRSREWEASSNTLPPSGPAQRPLHQPARRAFLIEAEESASTSASDSSDTDDSKSEDETGYLASDSVADFCPVPRKPRRRPSRPALTRSPLPREPHAPSQLCYTCRPNTTTAQRLPPRRTKSETKKKSQQAKREQMAESRAAVKSRLPSVGGGAPAASVSRGARRT